MDIQLALAFLAVFCAAWMLGYNSGAKQWRRKFNTLSELSLKLLDVLNRDHPK